MMKIFVYLLTSIVLVGCGSEHYNQMQVELDLLSARTSWSQNGLDTYSYSYDESCFCLNNGVIDIYVDDNEVISATYQESGESVATDDLRRLKTVEEWFDYIEKLISEEPDYIRVEYNELYGNPTVIEVDFALDGADDGVLHQIENLN